jgi:hypothetical protein
MSADRPPGPPSGDPAPRVGRQIMLGILLGVGALAVVSVVLIFVIGPLAPEAWLFGLPLLLIAYLATSIVIAAQPRTGPLGGGLLIGLGVFVLIGAGTCVALITQVGG